jgi:hypothetical protein
VTTTGAAIVVKLARVAEEVARVVKEVAQLAACSNAPLLLVASVASVAESVAAIVAKVAHVAEKVAASGCRNRNGSFGGFCPKSTKFLNGFFG